MPEENDKEVGGQTKTLLHFKGGKTLNVLPQHQSKTNIRSQFWVRMKKKLAEKANDTRHML